MHHLALVERVDHEAPDAETHVMRGFRFFEEFRDERRTDSLQSVVAVQMADGPFVQEGGVCYKAVCSSRERAVRGRAVEMVLFNAEYLGMYCRRISEAKARELHPEVFDFLERLA